MLATRILTLTALMVVLGFGSSAAQRMGEAKRTQKQTDGAAETDAAPAAAKHSKPTAKAGAKPVQPAGKPSPKLTKQQAKVAARQAKLEARQAQKMARLAQRKAQQHGKAVGGPGQRAGKVPGLEEKMGRGAKPAPSNTGGAGSATNAKQHKGRGGN